jgi:cyclopropane fatty-acyl-phospholipid synthase-like methyltransferase
MLDHPTLLAAEELLSEWDAFMASQMKTVAEHYAGHLAPIYLWSVGGAEAALALGESEVEALGLPVRSGDRILDLGAGFGAHAIPLARRGASVTAVDSSGELLAVLRSLAGECSMDVVKDDLLNFLGTTKDRFAAIVCLGDTLTHLGSLDEVNLFFSLARRVLEPGGKLIATFRDYTVARRGEERFIPVKGDEARILMCFLEFEESTVAVHDIVHEKAVDGWRTQVSAYRKLRLDPQRLMEALDGFGFEARLETGARGMVRLVAA